jgi:hypothetical protein
VSLAWESGQDRVDWKKGGGGGCPWTLVVMAVLWHSGGGPARIECGAWAETGGWEMRISGRERWSHAVCIRVGGTSFRLLVKINCLNFVYVVLKNCFISFKLDGYIYLPRLLSPFTF